MHYVMVGLGNPGTQHALNRHNIGFMVMDLIADMYNFPPFKTKFKSLISEKTINSHKIILVKPMTYMNLSGTAVCELLSFYKIPLKNMFVFHDELDIAPFRIKMKCGGGSGGHNGLSSLDQHCGKGYWRVRLGIGHPGHRDAVSGYVLGNFRDHELDDLTSLLNAVATGMPDLMSQEMGEWLTNVHQRLRTMRS